MSLRIKSLVFALVTVASVLISVYLLAEFVILRGFENLENDRTATNVHRAVNAVNADIGRLHTFTADWAYWDDTYQFIEDKNKEYIESNLVDTTFESTGLNLIMMIDNEGKPVYQKGYDLEAKKEIELLRGIYNHLGENKPLLTRSKDGVAGIIMVDDIPMIVSSRPILDSNKEGDSRGNLIMGYFVMEKSIEDFSNTTQLPLRILKPVDSLGIDGDVKIESADEISGQGILKDLYGKDAFVLRFTVPRNIYKEGQKTVSTVLIGLFSIGIIVTVIGTVYLERTILSRLFSLLNEVNKIGKSGDYSGRVSVRGHDEISNLANRINSMLELLEMSVETRLAASINSLPLGFFIVSTDHLIEAINPSMMNILGTRVRPQRLEELKSYFGTNFDLKQFCADCRTDLKLLKIDEYSYKDKIISIISVPIVDRMNDNLMGTAVIIQDITETKVLERAKDEFFAIASHELRTPLTVIRGNTSLIKEYFADQVKDSSLIQMFNDIHDSSVRLIRIVNDFLDVSRLEQDGKSTKAVGVEIDINEIIKKSIDGLSSKAQEKKIYIKYESTGTIKALGNSEMTRHVVDNLLSNAIAFTQKGGIIFTAALVDGMVKVTVSDTGIGISKDNQKLLFRKFQQAGQDVRRRDVTRGTGLGLYLSKLLLEQMNGKIFLEKSELGKGSTFSFTLPLAPKAKLSV